MERNAGGLLEAAGRICFGTWKIPENVLADVIVSALECGYRRMDTAAAYQNESSIGAGIASAILKGVCGRGELSISGKVWNADRGYDATLRACERTLENLGLDYLDSYLIHWPASPAVHEDWQAINADTWRAMERLYAEGIVRGIGVCNYLPHHLEPLMEDAKIQPMIDQVEIHPGQPQNETVEFCCKHGIEVQAWGALGSGKMMRKQALKDIAAKYDRSAAQLCIRWCLQRGITPIVRSKDRGRMAENLMVFDFVIGEEDMRALNDMPYLGGSGLDPDTLTLFG